MNKRPLSVTILGAVYIAMGAIGFSYHFTELLRHAFRYDIVWVEFLRLLAIVGGAFMLRGRNWARWIALAWIAFHVIVSAFHTVAEFSMHLLFFAAIAWGLFRPEAARYFLPAGRTTGI